MTSELIDHESFETVYLDGRSVRFAFDGENLTFIDSDQVLYPRVTLRRSFPLSAENANILVRTPDGEMERGKEIGILPDVTLLDDASREAVLRELRLYYFVPSILHIESIREEFGFLYWRVDTDRGMKDFIIRDSIIGSVRKVAEKRWLVIDINQTRYEIHNLDELDDHSQNLLRRYLLL